MIRENPWLSFWFSSHSRTRFRGNRRYVTIFPGTGIMDAPVQTFSSDYLDRRRWVGGVIIAVILGEAIWGLVVSVMNNLVVPWLGDVMGQSSGLPTSFTQRPYNYPDLFVSVLEACIAGLVAAILNYFIQRPRAARAPRQLRQMKSSTPPTLVPPSPVPPPPVATSRSARPPDAPRPASPVIPLSAVPKPEPAAPVAPANVTPPVVTARPVPTPPAEPAAPVAATKPPATPIVQPAKPKKTKEVYYNIVGEPMPYDDD
jgi:large-conductance mechanosensitive channel